MTMRAGISREMFRIRCLLGRGQALFDKLMRDDITEADRAEAEALRVLAGGGRAMTFTTAECEWLKSGLGMLLDDYRERRAMTKRPERIEECERHMAEISAIYWRLEDEQ